MMDTDILNTSSSLVSSNDVTNAIASAMTGHGRSGTAPPPPAEATARPSGRRLQLSVGSVTAVDRPRCYRHLHDADADADGDISPEEFLAFSRASAGGRLDVDEYGMPVAEFHHLPSEFVEIYNLYACGGALVVCPGTAIHIGSVSEALEVMVKEGELPRVGEGADPHQEIRLYQLCRNIHTAVDELPPPPTPPPLDAAPASLPPCAPPYDASVPMTALPDARVSRDGVNFRCRGAACNLAAYAPGTTGHYPEAWDYEGPCAPSSTFVPAPTTPLSGDPLGPLPCAPPYDAALSYRPGDIVSHGATNFLCREFPHGDGCNDEVHAPGTAARYPEAWLYGGRCASGQALPPCSLPHDATAYYSPGAAASHAGVNYVCRESPHGDRCNDAVHAPGQALHYPEAWSYRGQCVGGGVLASTETPSPTALPTENPITSSMGAVALTNPVSLPKPAMESPHVLDGGDDEELYTGPLPATFQYYIANTRNLDAKALLADHEVMALLRDMTTAFVEEVVASTFSNDRRMALSHHSRAHTAYFHHRGKGSLRGRRSSRVLGEVRVPPRAVTIHAVEDIACGVTAIAECQEVKAGVVLALVDQAPGATALRFDDAVARALEGHGVAFPYGGMLRYRGPAGDDAQLVEFFDATLVDGLPDDPQQEEGGGGAPQWAVGIGVSVSLAFLVVLLVRLRSTRRRKKEKASWTREEGSLYLSELENDLTSIKMNPHGDGTFDAKTKINGSAAVAAQENIKGGTMSHVQGSEVKGKNASSGLAGSNSSSTCSTSAEDSEEPLRLSVQLETGPHAGKVSQIFSVGAAEDEEEDDIYTPGREEDKENEGKADEEEYKKKKAAGRVVWNHSLSHLPSISEEQIDSSDEEIDQQIHLWNTEIRASTTSSSSSDGSCSSNGTEGKAEGEAMPNKVPISSFQIPAQPEQDDGPRRRQIEDQLRATFRSQSQEGESCYEREQYAIAAACFKDARFALLTMESKGEGREGSAKHDMNLALLSERITDCHVQNFSLASTGENEATNELDTSHINYRQAVAMVTQSKEQLSAEIALRRGLKDGNGGNNEENMGATSDEIIKAEVNALNDLYNEATLALARILTKQAGVCAMLNNHYEALDSFRDSLAAWEEAANINHQEERKTLSEKRSTVYDPLLIETHGSISPGNDSSKLPPYDVDSLKNTSHLKALSTAFQMAKSHHAVAVEVALAAEDDSTTPSGEHADRFRASIKHHLQAMQLICETQRLRAASIKSSTTTRFLGAAKRVVAANKVLLGGARLTPQGRDLSVFKNQSDLKDISSNVGQFLKRCTLLMVQQKVCISHACSSLGLRNLSKKWLSTALDEIDETRFSDAKNEAKAILNIISLVKRDIESEMERPLDRMSLYEGGSLISFTIGCKEEPRLFVHYAFEALHKGLPKGAMVMLQKTAEVYELSSPPEYHDELLHAIDAKIIIHVKDNEIERAVQEMHRRMDVVSRWLGNSSLELATDMQRLACFYSSLGQHEQCIKHLEESLHIGSGYENYDALNPHKLLAVTFDNTNDVAKAMHHYEFSLSMEEDIIIKANLLNALSFLLIKVGGQSQLAAGHLDESINIQQNDPHSESKVSNLLLDTMILYGNAMVSQKYFSQALDWYESALSSNPEKSAIHPSNLRAWYNKGLTLFRSGDISGADDAFKVIVDQVDRNPTTAPSETASILNGIGSIYFWAKLFPGAVKLFNQSLSLRNGCLSPIQRAGTLCNIGSALYSMQKYEESEQYLTKALGAAESAGEPSLYIEGTILCKLAYILYKRKSYLHAQNIFNKAASIGSSCEELGDKFSLDCEDYAKTCHQLMNQDCMATATTTIIDPSLKGLDEDKTKESAQETKDEKEDDLGSGEKCRGAPRKEVIAKKPKFEGRLITITNEHDETRYNSGVYPLYAKILMALGVKSSHGELASFSDDRKTLCNKALECLLKQTEECRAKYAFEFEELLVEEMNSNFMTLKSLLGHALQTSVDE